MICERSLTKHQHIFSDSLVLLKHICVMNQPKESFLKNRIKSIGFSFRGIWILIRTESSIKIQLFVAVLATILGFYFDLTSTEWMLQFLVIGLVLVAEALNTAIEKLADFVHPDFHKKIGLIKDIGAGAAGIAAIISLIIAGFIYLPKFEHLF